MQGVRCRAARALTWRDSAGKPAAKLCLPATKASARAVEMPGSCYSGVTTSTSVALSRPPHCALLQLKVQLWSWIHLFRCLHSESSSSLKWRKPQWRWWHKNESVVCSVQTNFFFFPSGLIFKRPHLYSIYVTTFNKHYRSPTGVGLKPVCGSLRIQKEAETRQAAVKWSRSSETQLGWAKGLPSFICTTWWSICNI